ncbi:Bacteriophage HK97-gp10, putative tail-component [Moorella glycerini]|uniref:Uncharacterized protein n=1 Tax=Neomoorella stamsii TaxID=1266720 RepID=A0A9X7J0D3_9FIRM|nr:MULTISPECIES: HK97 gp10 family phage protein [Moorella]PRR69596.1 hypothetical protein MOST_30180 [Moorella stamsii]CEP67880.1 Bacteriophage HK97-gp10, putative tail-component [Moorella glycerini]CEP68750.1 Bacteriophage HK97-gp10, putative tail-component [Moorella glycerini]
MRDFPTGEQISQIVKRAAFDALYTATEGLLTKIINNTPIKTGTLRRSQTVTPYRDRMMVSISANTPYAVAVHEGSKPHEIIPREAKALAFIPVAGMRLKDRKPLYRSKTGRLVVSKKRAAVVFAKRVRHPGYKGNPWMKRTVEQNIDKVGKYVLRSVKKALKEELG